MISTFFFGGTVKLAGAGDEGLLVVTGLEVLNGVGW